MPTATAGFRAAALQAQLVLASLLLCLLPITLLLRPPQTHAVKIDLPVWPEPASPAAIRPKLLLMTSIVLPEPPPNIRDAGDVVPLEVTRDGRILLAGQDVDPVRLRMGLDHIAPGGQWIDFRPDPDARYALFLEVLAIVRRAGIDRLHLAHSPFGDALDSGRGY